MTNSKNNINTVPDTKLDKVRRAVGAIVVKDNKFLLVQRFMRLTKDGMKKIEPEWDIIKGGIDEDKSSRVAMMRELYEETGSKKFIIVKQFENVLSYPLIKESEFDRQEIIMFLIRYDGKLSDLKPDYEEISAIEWFTYSQAISKIKYDETREFFKKYAHN